MDFFPLLLDATGHLLCFLKFRLLIHMSEFHVSPSEEKEGDICIDARERWSAAIWRGRDRRKSHLRLKPVAFLLTQVCVIDISPKLQTMRAKVVDSSTYVCKSNIPDVNLEPNVFIKTSYLALHTHLSKVNVNLQFE